MNPLIGLYSVRASNASTKIAGSSGIAPTKKEDFPKFWLNSKLASYHKCIFIFYIYDHLKLKGITINKSGIDIFSTVYRVLYLTHVSAIPITIWADLNSKTFTKSSVPLKRVKQCLPWKNFTDLNLKVLGWSLKPPINSDLTFPNSEHLHRKIIEIIRHQETDEKQIKDSQNLYKPVTKVD